MNLCALDGFFELKRRENSGHSFRKHGFAGTRRADEQNIVASGSRDLDGALCMRLASHFAKVVRIVIEVGQKRLSVDVQWERRLIGVEQVHNALERRNRIHLKTID